MEALLQEALDEFDDEPDASARPAAAASPPPPEPPPSQPIPPPAPPTPAPAPAPAPAAAGPPEPQEELDRAIDDVDADELARQLMDGLNIGVEGNDAEGMEQTLKALARSAETLAQDQSEGEGPDPMELLKQLGLGDAGGASAAGGASSGASGEQLDGLLDSLVGQLLSKEVRSHVRWRRLRPRGSPHPLQRARDQVMLEPMQHLHKELPNYLAEKGDSLSAADRARFEKQELIIGQILVAYDEEPNDPDKVATLMQEMQQCGPPPTEIAGPIAGLDAMNGCVVS